MRHPFVIAGLVLAGLAALGTVAWRAPAPPGSPPCGDAGLVVPDGFCAVRLADGLGRVRQLAVLPNGDVAVALSAGGAVLLRDADGDGAAEIRRPFGTEGGTGIAYHEGYLWFGRPDEIVRWPWPVGALEPAGPAEIVVEGLPTGGHSAKTFTFLGGDSLIVNIGSESNSCQEQDRSVRSPGHDPCTELQRRAGLWLFSAARLRQRPPDGTRYATGLRNAMALAVEPATGRLYAAPHGRDQLGQNWGFTDLQNAELPAEELLPVSAGTDAGWPYCYYDWQQKKKVLAPEYGGDGRAVGRCRDKTDPVVAFPGHWAPMALAFYTGTSFPAKYRGGAFVAFHGSWNRAPLPQEGYRIAFAPFRDGRAVGTYETFATAAGGPTGLRASGVAVGPDGSLYIADERSGAIWRVTPAP